VLLVHGTVAGLVSATLFGGAFLAVPAGTAHLARRRTPPASWTAAIGGLTVAFAIGQCIGPGLAGVLAERSGGTAVGMLIAAVVLAGAALVNLAGEHPAPR
jgi:predicted MFS family arabinose efflux permease